MRKMIVSGAVLLWATVFVAAGVTPLNVKTGVWQVTMISKVGSTPNTSTYKSCVKKEDLGEYPFTDPMANCTWKVLSSTGSVMEATGTCKPEGMGNMTFSIKLVASDSENVKGTGQLTGAFNGTYSGTAKWIGAKCPANLN